MTNSRRCSVPFGRGELAFLVPEHWSFDVAASPPVREDQRRALRFPDDTFASRVRAARRAVIVFTDATRESPDQLLAVRALRDLLTAGMAPDRIEFLCAIGMHRPSTPEEKLRKLGREILARFPVYDHDPADVVTVGQVDGVPIQTARRLAAPGTLIVALGVVELHQYAGYSGGAKTVVIGCGGADTIAITHSPEFLRHERVRPGEIEGNPFQGFVREAGRLLGLQRVYNALLDDDNLPILEMSGPPDVVHDALVAAARQHYEVPVDAPYDVVVTGVGAPKDANLYQASRAATTIGLSSQQVIRPGGVIILPAPVPEGAGMGQGEQNFITALGESSDLSALQARLDAEGCQPGEQRAYMVAQLLARYRVIVVGAEHPAVVKQAHLAPVDTMDEAFALARVWCGTREGHPRLLIVPHALQTLPIPAY
jgi:nickel-dependent lactate racemase